MTHFRGLCAELLEALELESDPIQHIDLKDRARTALATPVPTLPTDCEILDAQSAAGICDPNWCDRSVGDALGRLQQLRTWVHGLIACHSENE